MEHLEELAKFFNSDLKQLRALEVNARRKSEQLDSMIKGLGGMVVKSESIDCRIERFYEQTYWDCEYEPPKNVDGVSEHQLKVHRLMFDGSPKKLDIKFSDIVKGADSKCYAFIDYEVWETPKYEIGQWIEYQALAIKNTKGLHDICLSLIVREPKLEQLVKDVGVEVFIKSICRDIDSMSLAPLLLGWAFFGNIQYNGLWELLLNEEGRSIVDRVKNKAYVKDELIEELLYKELIEFIELLD